VVNKRISRIKRFARWCCKNELLPPERYESLRSVDGLRKGRSGAKETEPIAPVPREHVESLLPYVAPPVAAMIQVQYLCGMRPGEVTVMRRCDIDVSGEIWLYTPEHHKGEWRGQGLIKAIPQAAQEIIRPFFKPNLDDYLFSPRDAEQWRYQNRPPFTGRQRKTPIYPSELRQREKAKARRRQQARKRQLLDHYDTNSYRRAITYGIKRAARAGVHIPHWHPNQLRHAIATEVSQTLGQQAAQRWLGHVNLKTTDIYVEKQVRELVAIARELDRRWAV
jgi:integrase